MSPIFTESLKALDRTFKTLKCFLNSPTHRGTIILITQGVCACFTHALASRLERQYSARPSTMVSAATRLMASRIASGMEWCVLPAAMTVAYVALTAQKRAAAKTIPPPPKVS